MSTQHTPGPWEVDATGYRAADNGLCVMAWPECVAVVGAGNPDQPQDANARLIAAAPELTEAAENAISQITSHLMLLKCDDEFISSQTQQLRAAIAKARGAA